MRTIDEVWADIVKAQVRHGDLARKVERGLPGHVGYCKALHDAAYELAGLQEELEATKLAMTKAPAR